jgi:dienelactone hydrolase
MKTLFAFIAFALCANALGANAIETFTGEWVDTNRDNRKVPYRVYHPAPLERSYPVIVVSHGLGGSKDGNELLGRHLAGNGFVTVHVQHAGSDENLYQNARSMADIPSTLQRSLARPINAINRFQDLPFTLKQLEKLNEEDAKLKGRLNLGIVGMAGHSYGSVSTMVAAGERVGEGYTSFKVPKIMAAVSLSPSPPGEGLDPARAYADISIPIFHITGTDDVNMVERGRDVKAPDRLVPYQTLTIPSQYLLVLNKADHATFSGRRIKTRAEKYLDKAHMGAVLNGSLVFFQTHLLGSDSAKRWLQSEFKKTLAPEDRFEFK